MHAAPLLSVVMSRFNAALRIEATLFSVLAQQCPGDMEVIVRDDGFSGDPAQALRDTQLGVAAARNCGIEMSPCACKALINADDT
ncbi:MAG: glycosyltransferase [Rubrivivax sp.]|nr:glycosyltransferase [Rubrivivax sp.]